MLLVVLHEDATSDKLEGILSVQSPWNDLCSAKQAIFSLTSEKGSCYFNFKQAYF